jgi:hypothetical protein
MSGALNDTVWNLNCRVEISRFLPKWPGLCQFSSILFQECQRPNGVREIERLGLIVRAVKSERIQVARFG